jgi:AcrR family transcriptional regulator
VKDPFREEILAGARELLERFGFKKTTMEDIARKVGKSKSALYYYYKTKEEIFEAVILQDLDQQHKVVLEAMQKEETAYRKFTVFFTTMFSDVKLKANKFSVFKTDLYENHFLIDNILKQRDSHIEELLKNVLILGISQQQVKMMSNAEIDLWAKMINLTMKSLGNKLFLDDEFVVSDSQMHFMAEVLFNGVRA